VENRKSELVAEVVALVSLSPLSESEILEVLARASLEVLALPKLEIRPVSSAVVSLVPKA
jgi:hypothetical protein